VPDAFAPGPFDDIARFYDRRVDEFGHDVRACDYGREESQRIKFEVLSEVLPVDGLTLLDVGCGFADYASYLEERFPALRYTGIDISPRMVEEARRLHPGLDIRLGNILEGAVQEDFDVVTANGIFYLLGAEAPELMRCIVGQMFGMARLAVAFNSLSAWAPDREPGEFYANPTETVGFCGTLTRWVSMRHDYHPRDFTVYLYRAARRC
jgi:SAM-dependent methyltransferase